MTPLVPFPMQRAIPTLEISPAFEAVVLRALAQDPEQRHPTARALHDALVAAEQATMRGSLLPRDPLCWGATRHEPGAEDSSSMSQTEVSRPAIAAGAATSGASNAQLRRTAPDLSPSGSWQAWTPGADARPASTWPGIEWAAAGRPLGLMVRATLALAVTTALVRAAWSLVA